LNLWTYHPNMFQWIAESLARYQEPSAPRPPAAAINHK
jgi:hypothetical protein